MIKAIQRIEGKNYPDSAVDLGARAAEETPGFEFWLAVAATWIAVIAMLARRNLTAG
ncbi:MAG: hypothetical protein N3F63_07725 [Thermoplasmata archaeon]|nr:hypothetical protein [Thermoplasmata archaeon]